MVENKAALQPAICPAGFVFSSEVRLLSAGEVRVTKSLKREGKRLEVLCPESLDFPSLNSGNRGS